MKEIRLICSCFSLLLIALLSLNGCAGLRDESYSDEASDSGMSDAPCTECGAQGEIKLKITAEKFYREWNSSAYSRMDSSAVVGVFPSLRVIAKRPDKCKMCHSFGADALDFDLAHYEDSLFVAAFPNMKRELMLPGMRLPESDSSYMDTLSVNLLKSEFADGKMLQDLSPWIERDGIEQAYSRDVPRKLKNLLNDIASRYELRYISVPVSLEVEMLPDAGKSGGYMWKILWTLWDARYGELVFLVYSEFMAETTGRVSPEKDWANPFAIRLSKMFSVDFTKLESH